MAKIKNYIKHHSYKTGKGEDGMAANSPAVPKAKSPNKHDHADAKMSLGIAATAPPAPKVKKPLNDSNSKTRATGKPTNAAPPKAHKSKNPGFKSY